MTKKEKILVQTAINRLCDDDGWNDGMYILKRLINPTYKNPLLGLTKVTLDDICLSTEYVYNDISDREKE